MSDTVREMPKYKCHKEVWALKIKSIEHDINLAKEEGRETDGSSFLGFEEPGYDKMNVSREFMKKHNPEVGGYYVVYADGYQSYSPAKAFEEGYTRI